MMRRSHQFQLLSKLGAAPTEKEIKFVDMGAEDVKEYWILKSDDDDNTDNAKKRAKLANFNSKKEGFTKT